MIKYIKNLIRHKWFVFLEACNLGIPFLGIIHDISKFMPDEFIPYSKYDFSKFNNNPPELQNAFDKAWLKHQKRNKHHWQYWLLMNDSGWAGKRYETNLEPPVFVKQVVPLEMPHRYVLEMVADWRGAGRAYGNPDTMQWFINNRDKIVLHPETESKVLSLLEKGSKKK